MVRQTAKKYFCSLQSDVTSSAGWLVSGDTVPTCWPFLHSFLRSWLQHLTANAVVFTLLLAWFWSPSHPGGNMALKLLNYQLGPNSYSSCSLSLSVVWCWTGSVQVCPICWKLCSWGTNVERHNHSEILVRVVWEENTHWFHFGAFVNTAHNTICTRAAYVSSFDSYFVTPRLVSTCFSQTWGHLSEEKTFCV